MVQFPCCKVNLGLDVIRKRPDGYHDIETVMLPLRGLCDSLEIIRAGEDTGQPLFTSSGITVDCPPDNNIVVKAWRLMHDAYGIGDVKIHLHKAIPFGAGLGGGSADAAYALRMLNTLFSAGISDRHLERMGLILGSDVPFFIYDKTQHCSGRGEIMRPVNISLKGYWIALVKPPVFIPTAEAYSGIRPRVPAEPLMKRLSRPVSEWKDHITNDFEETVFGKHPRLGSLKKTLYDSGALYASMSGSGSSIYGIFNDRPQYSAPENHASWIMQL